MREGEMRERERVSEGRGREKKGEKFSAHLSYLEKVFLMITLHSSLTYRSPFAAF